MNNPVLKNILGIVAGVIAGGIVVFLVELVGHTIFPPPEGTDLSDPEAMRTLIDSLPAGALVSVVVGWFLGSLTGCFTAQKIAGSTLAAWIVAVLFICLTAYNFTVIPHPLWMMAAGILLPLVAALLVIRRAAVA
jgi:hypothetical protein